MRAVRSILAGTLILGCAASSAAQRAGDIELRLSADRTSPTLGEPVVVTVAFANVGATEVDVYPLFEPTYGFVSYEITHPDGRREPFQPMWLDEGVASTVAVAPGAEVRGFARLFRSSAGTVFDVPGDYTVVARSAGLVSAPLALRVEPAPAGAADTARTMVRDDVTEFLFLEGGAHLAAARAALETVARQSASPVLAGYARCCLGASAAAGGRDFATGQAIEPRPGESIRLLQRATAVPLTPYYEARAHQVLIRAFVQSGDLPRARAELSRFDARFADDDRVRFQRTVSRRLIEKAGR